MEVGAATAAIQMQGFGGYGCRPTMEIRWAFRRKDCDKKLSPNLKSRVPIYISTNPSHINPKDLTHLYTNCNHSCHRFPKLDHMGEVIEPVDTKKLCIALSHSSVLVSVFCNSQDLGIDDVGDGKGYESDDEKTPQLIVGLGDMLQRVLPVPVPVPAPMVSPSNGQLVGFGRAVSDLGLTASIYDVMVVPSLQGMGIGKMIVKRLIRILTSRDIYDIAALCSAEERLFFKACGFGDDVLGSTTMMYTRTVSTDVEGNQMVKYAGRKLLLAPPLREPFKSLKTIKS